MKSFKLNIVSILIIVLVFSRLAVDTYATNSVQLDSVSYVEIDSLHVFQYNIIEPVESHVIPQVSNRIDRINTEKEVLQYQAMLLNCLSVQSVDVSENVSDTSEFAVGSIPLSSSISPSGGRIYTLPIPVASGWSAVPQLTLLYNSQSANGIAGYGWSLGGLSSIEIRNKNSYYDGNNQHAVYDSDVSVFSLDGLPIVSSMMEVDGFEFETARNNILVKKHLTPSGVLSHFTVLYPNGNRGTFGYVDNVSCQTSYPLTELIDMNGNTISFQYEQYYNSYYISSVHYGKDAHIDFRYQTRTDIGHWKYEAGNVNLFPYKRIVSIISYDGDSIISQYDLSYEYKDGVSLLREINQISDGVSYRPISFTYGIDTIYDQEESFSLNEQNYFYRYFNQTEDDDIVYIRGKFIPGGFNDGIIMLPQFSNYDKVDTKLLFYHKYGSKYHKDQVILCNPSAIESSAQFEIKAGSGFQTIRAVDVDGDGTDEIVKINNGSSVEDKTDFKVYIYSFDRYGTASCDSMTFRINDGSHNICFNNPAQCDYYFGNYQGTGKEMLLIATRERSHFALIDLYSKTKVSETSLINMNDENVKWILSADIEGDGQDDICYITENGMEVYSLISVTETTFSQKITYTGISRSLLKREPYYTINGYPSLQPATLYIVDVNGDGFNDIAAAPYFSVEAGDGYVINSPTWNISVFDGKSFHTQNYTLYTRREGDEIIFLDVDKDGLPDMLHKQESGLLLIPNVNGVFLRKSNYTNITIDDNAELLPCDISTYGKHGEIITVAGPWINVYAFNVSHTDNRSLIQFTDSFGTRHINRYSDISRNNGAYLTDHTRTYDSESGFMRQRVPLSVLFGSSVVTNGFVTTEEYYTYYDAVFNSRGLGFCGFGQVRKNDYIHGLVTLGRNDPEKMGVQIRYTKALQSTSNSPFEEVINTYDNYTTTHGKLNPRLIKSITVDYLTNVTTNTSVSYGSYSLPSLTTITKTAGDGVVYTEKISNEYKHCISSDKYILGSIAENSVRRNNGNTDSHLSWKERTVYTYDEQYRPLTKTEYVGDFGRIPGYLQPIEPFPDTLIIIPMSYDPDFEEVPQVPVDTLLNKPSSTNYDAIYMKSKTVWDYDSRSGKIISEKISEYSADTLIGNTFVYDTLGRYLISETDPLGRTTTYSEFNKFGQPEIETDFRGRTTSYTYDEWGNLIKTVYPDGTVENVLLEWGGQGLYTLTKTSSAAPSTISHYDTFGNEIRNGTQRFDGQWQFVDRLYDVKGRLLKESLPYRGTAPAYWNQISYDEYNRKISLTEPSGKISTWAYDGTSVTSCQNGISSTRTYDANGNLSSVADAGGTITYELRDDGQPSSVIAPGNVVTSFEYDNYGRRIKISDPSAGTQTDTVVFNHDGSSVATHINPNGSIITYKDRYGRTIKVERPGEYTTDYVYDSYGLLVSEISSNGTSKTYTYDNLDRVSVLTEVVPDGKWLKKTFTYTLGGNIETVAYESQNGFIAIESYSYSNGVNTEITVQENSVKRILAENDLGQPTIVISGGLSRAYSYNAYGIPTRRTMGSVMDYSYTFDPLKGNLMSRTDNLRNQTETFGYDALNRLAVIDEREITYSDNGNITSIDSVGDMTYDNSAKPYQVTSLTLEEDVVLSRVQNVTYTCYSRPSIMTEGGRSAAFTYNGDGARVKMNVSDGATSVLSRYYIGNQYELDVTPNGTTERLYLGGDAYSAPAVYVKEGSGAWTFYNIGRDYLGNITHIATADGTLVEENSYDPWGRLRNPETKEIYSLGTEPELMLGRGYTGHEHLTWFGLINMNARLYDPVLGRFLSPDPFVQMPDFTQNFNRYSYCLNNPLVYVDENGELWSVITAILRLPDTIIRGVFIPFFVGFSDTRRAGQIASSVWQEYGRTVANAAKIDYGIIYTDKNKSAGGRIWEFFSRFLWQPKQFAVGYFASGLYNLFGGVKSVSFYGGATVSESYASGWGDISLGNYIIGQNGIYADPANPDFQHEYGHYIQSQRSGYAYFPRYGVPSLFSKPPHDYHPVEQDANIRAFNYFSKHVSGFNSVDAYGNYNGMWDLGYSPILGLKPTDTTVLDKRLKWSFWDLLAGFVPIVGDFAGGGIRSHYDRKKY